VTPAESARLHREHLGVGGMTDVITYRHGDIVVCPAVAWREASRRGLTFRNELLRYCVHGWLHLRGHDDHEEAARVRMHRRQEELVGQLEAGAQKD
jgi:probable rRNA maturation factor